MSIYDLQDSLISVNINLSGIPVPAAGFGTVLIVSPEAVPGGTVLVLTYSSATASVDLAADVVAGKLTQPLADAVAKGFSQSPRPAVIKVAKVPALASPSTLAVDMAAIQVQDDDFYGVILDCSAAGIPIAVQATIDANLLAMAAWCETQDKVFLASGYDVLVYAAGGGAAAALKALSYENTAFIWSQLVAAAAPGTAYQYSDVAALCRWLAFDPDVISAPFRASLTGIVRAQTTAAFAELTAAQIAFAQGHNSNLGLQYGSAACFVDQGVNCSGRAWEEVLSKHWLQARIREDIASTAVDLADRGRKFGANNEGIAICKGIMAKRLQQGVSAGHFSGYSIGAGSGSGTTITIAAEATVLDNARSFTFNIEFV